MIATKAQWNRAADLRGEVVRLGLRRHPRFDSLSVEQLAEIYNGIGPDAWPAVLRDAITEIVYYDCEPLPFVHDVDFAYSDGTAEGFEASTARWLENGRLVLADRFPAWQFWRWRDRALCWAKINAAYLALLKLSRPAWDAAAKREVRGNK